MTTPKLNVFGLIVADMPRALAVSDSTSGRPTSLPEEMVPIEHEMSERIVRTLVFGIPPLALVVGGWLAWGGVLRWQDLVVLAVYVGNDLNDLLARFGIQVEHRTVQDYRHFHSAPSWVLAELPGRRVRRLFHPSAFGNAPDRGSLLSHVFQNSPHDEPKD